MSITNSIFSPSNNRNEETINRLKTISKSIKLYNNIYNNNPNIQYRECNSIFNYNKNYKNKDIQLSSNTHSIENIFNPNRKNKNNDSPLKIYFNKNNDKNLNTIYYSTTNEIKLERKLSSKSNISNKNNYSPNKSANIYKNESLTFEPFSPKRILTIPQNNHYGYAVDDNGETELLDDPKIDEKFNGTKNNSIGPGRYNIVISPRKRLIIDWSKLSEERLLLVNQKRKNKIKKDDLAELHKLDNLYLSANITNENKSYLNDNYSILMNSKNKSKSINNIDLNNFRNKIFRNNNIKLKGFKSEDDYVNLTELNYIQKKNDDQTLPGPGSYNYSDEFLINPKKNKYQNFGSFVSRDLLLKSPKKKKNNPIENYIKYSFFADNNLKDKIFNEKSESLKKEKSKLFNNSLKVAQKLKIEELKEKNIKNKKELSKKLGPGTYNPEIHKLKRSNGIENFGTLEKRKLTTVSGDNPGIVSYIPLKDWTKKYNNNFKTIETEINEEKYKLYREKNYDLNLHNNDEEKNEIKNENKFEKDPYYNKSIDYDNKLNVIKNKKRPGFGSREPRFHIFKSQINELNGVGKYNLIPLKKQRQQFSPFIYSSSRSNIIKKDNNANLGPGTYNKFDTFFDWNKKTYNVKEKNKIDKYKNLKN